MTKPTTREPTFSLEQLNAVVAKAVAEALEQREKNTRTVDVDALAIKAFRRAGYGQVTPRVDIKTFGKWAEEGLRPKEGERAVKCRSLRLFHRSQCRELSAEERKAFADKAAAKTSDRLPMPSPVAQPVKAPVKGKPKSKAAKIVPLPSPQPSA